MKMFSLLLTAGAFAGGALVLATPAAADRLPNEQERVAVERALRDAGFVGWEEIELDEDGPVWEVDDARTRARARFDVELHPVTLRIVRRQADR